MALATAFAHGRGGFISGGGSWQRARDGEGQRGGSAFIGGQLRRERKGSKAGLALSIRRRWPSIGAAPLTGRERKGVGEERKVDDTADRWG